MQIRKMKNPYILKWNRADMVLADGSLQKEFSSQENAWAALEYEIANARIPILREKFRNVEARNEMYRVVQLQVTRVVRGVEMLYGVSEYYLRPFSGNNAVKEVLIDGIWYRNVNDRYYYDNFEPEEMPWKFFQESERGEYICYYDRLLFHTSNGFIMAHRDDLSNRTQV